MHATLRRYEGVDPRFAPNLREFHCAKCGYGISLSGALPSCPMCQATGWESTPKRTERRAEMATGGKIPEQAGAAEERAQKELTKSVGTALVRPKKPSRRKLFGRRREQRDAMSADS